MGAQETKHNAKTILGRNFIALIFMIKLIKNCSNRTFLLAISLGLKCGFRKNLKPSIKN